MRPDKKGKRKPHPGQRAGAGRAPQAPPPRASWDRPGGRAAPVGMSSGGAVTVPAPAATPAAQQGPRVLEPAAPACPNPMAKYHHRKIVSNWAKYDETTEELEPGEDYRLGDTFDQLLAVSATGAGYFSLRSERSWLDEASGAAPALLTLDTDHVADVLRRVPLHQRLDIAACHFTDEELDEFAREASQTSGPDAPATGLERAEVQQSRREQVCQHTLDVLRSDSDAGVGAGPGLVNGALAGPAGEQAVADVQGRTTVSDSSPADVGSAAADSAPVPAAAAAAGRDSDVTHAVIDVTPSAGDGGSVTAAGAAAAPPCHAPAAGDVKIGAVCGGGGTAGLLDDDWLDSVLSDDD